MIEVANEEKCFISSPDLIVDLGMNNGDDTEYYLRKAHRVVAVEANPHLCEVASKRFHTELSNGRLTIVNAAIWEGFGRETFFVNLDNDHWSSLDPAWAMREGSRCEGIEIDCIPLSDIFSRFGIPFYLKIDIEGADKVALDQLIEFRCLPQYVSLEDCRFGYEYIEALGSLGFSGFKLLDQSTVCELFDETLDYRFEPGSSGPFGEEIPGGWNNREKFEEIYSNVVRDRNNNRKAPRTHWWDIHCRGTEVG